jgi:divalent metal cation (Fe/Co/Zn/Cd) transporter
VRERVLTAALTVSHVREIHNLTVIDVDGSLEVSLHLKLPGDLSLEEAHHIAEEVEQAIREAVPDVDGIQTHIEPLAEDSEGTRPHDVEVADDYDLVERIVRDATDAKPEELRFLHTEEGLIAYLTLRLGPGTALADAHALASEIEEAIRRERPEIADVIVHTEPHE